MNKCWKFIYANPAVRADIQVGMEMNLDAGKDLSCKLKYWNAPRNPVLSKLFQAIWLDKLNEFAKRSALDVSISSWRYFTSLEIFVFQTEWTSRWGALPLPRVEAKLFSRKVQLRIKRYFYSLWYKQAKIYGLYYIHFLSLGKGGATKLDEFAEKFQTANPPPPSFLENYIAIFSVNVWRSPI